MKTAACGSSSTARSTTTRRSGPSWSRRGTATSTRCDTETIVHAYEQWGDRAVERFRGMFAFAIWDPPRRRLLLARDRLGIKPLYWTVVDDRLLFGSEIKAILESGLVRAEANERAVPELLSTRYLSGTRRCSKASTGSFPATCSSSRTASSRRRSGGTCPSRIAIRARRELSDREAVERFRQGLEDAVRTRLMADVPLGHVPVGRASTAARLLR